MQAGRPPGHARRMLAACPLRMARAKDRDIRRAATTPSEVSACSGMPGEGPRPRDRCAPRNFPAPPANHCKPVAAAKNDGLFEAGKLGFFTGQRGEAFRITTLKALQYLSLCRVSPGSCSGTWLPQPAFWG